MAFELTLNDQQKLAWEDGGGRMLSIEAATQRDPVTKEREKADVGGAK